MQSLEAACEEAEIILEKLNTYPLPLTRPQDCQENNFGIYDTNNSNKSSFCIFTKLEELYREECSKDQETPTNNKSNSFLLEKLVARESLNTLILNLYPDKNEYSFSLRMGSIVDDLNVGNNLDKTPNTLSDENMIKMSWHPDDELLKYIDNEELPCILVDILEQEHQELFYSGCIIVEVRDYQQTNSQVLCETRHVLLKPTVQSLWADMNVIMDKTGQEWSEEEKLELESELTLATNPVLCLDPTPTVSVINSIVHHQRYIFNTEPLKKCAQRFSLVNRKRKLDAISQDTGLDLHDFISKKRQRSMKSGNNSLSKLKSPRMVLPAPSLETKKALSLPENVNTTKFRSYMGPRETRNCMPHLIEQYILDTDRQCERDPKKLYHLHIKLSILQRPFNSEYLGELYLDVDYEEGKNNGASSRFTLGSRSYVDKFIRQFTDMLTKKGRKSMNIMKRVPGQEPRYICIPGMIERDKTVEPAQQAQVHTTQQAVQTSQIQSAQAQVLSGPSVLANGSPTANVVLVSNQTAIQNTSSSVPILQAQLQTNCQTKLEARHAANPEITALVASFISTAQQIEQEAAANAAAAAASAKSSAVASGSNAAILSLLNTSPVNNVNSATSAAVANAITNSNNSVGSVVGLSPQQTVQTVNQKILGRKMTITNVPRVLNHGNVITVNNNSVAGSTVVSVPQQVRISALASQLASPPVNVIIATANTSQQQQGQAFTLTTVSGTGFPTHVSYTTVPLNNATSKPATNQAARLMATGVSSVGTLRTISKTCASESNTGMSVSGLSALLVNTPAADHPIPGSNNASALLERLTASSGASSVPADNPTQFTVQTSKTIQQIPSIQLSKNNPVITPLSSPSGQQTLNLHTLNLTPFQGTLNNISGIQNVQVQIPRLSSPLNSSSTATIQAPTGLIFSVAVTTATTTCTSTTQQVNSIATSSLNSSGSTVVITNTAPGSVSPVLPLPIAHLVASGVKSLNQQGIRVTSPNTVSLAQTGKSVQLVGTLPRNTQMAGVKAARGLLQAQRMANAALKMATSNTTPAQMTNATLAGTGMNVASNSVVTLSTQQRQQQQLQLTLQKQAQFQQFHSLTQQQLQNCLNQQQQKTVSPAAVATKHHRRSNAADPNK